MMKEDDLHKVSLSVIVPCYNVEGYLDRSLASLERQWDGRTDYEIILINDASTDRTIDKLNEFKCRYPEHVIVIDKKENEGVAKARNSGLDIARGEWVVFMDPDDALRRNSYGRMLELLERASDNIDILTFGVEIVNEEDWTDSRMGMEFQGGIDTVVDSYDFMLKNHFGTCYKFIYRRRLISDHRFPPLMFLEDVLFTLPLMLRRLAIAVTAGKAYYYIVRKTSVTNITDPERLNRGCDDILTAIKQMEKLKKGHPASVQKRITDHQNFYTANLFSRLLLTNKNVTEIARIRTDLEAMSLLPMKGNGNKLKLYNLLFRYPALIPLFRPIYKRIRQQ